MNIQGLNERLKQGDCCSVALVGLALENRNEENPTLLTALSALCGGIQSGLICGALTGGAVMIRLTAPEALSIELIKQLSQWFLETYKAEYGGPDCHTILDGSALNKSSRCPVIVESVFIKVLDLLEENGITWEQTMNP